MLQERSPAAWVPTLYFAQGFPYVIVSSVVSLALLRFGWTAGEVAAWTSALTLPWVLKPLWGPLVERVGTRRSWVLAMQAVCGALVLALAFVLPQREWLPLTLILLLAMGLASSTHDIAADGLYLMSLEAGRQAAWSGVRSAAFRGAILAGGGGLVWLAGKWEKNLGVNAAWTGVFALAAAVLFAIYAYHYSVLPRPEADVRPKVLEAWGEQFLTTWWTFVKRPGFGRMLVFMLFYRVGEAQLLKGNQAFYLAARAQGGLELATAEIGKLYGTYGVAAMIVGGIAGGLMISRTGLRRQLWWMAAAMNLPHLIYIWLAWIQPGSRWLIGTGIVLEQLGYGFGFAAYMVYLLFVARGAHPTAHYALCTGVMALGMLVWGELAAAMLTCLYTDYLAFFIWVMICSVLSFGILWKLPLEESFGRRSV